MDGEERQGMGMKRFYKMATLLLSIAVLFFGLNSSVVGVQAADSSNTTGKLVIKLSGANKVKILSGKKNIAKKTIRMEKGSKVSFSPAKDKKVKSVTSRSMNKKYVTVSKKGKVTAKKTGTAKVNITIKKKKGKAVSTWVKIKVVKAEDRSHAFDLKKGTVKLNNGKQMPVLGIGTFTLSNKEAENSVYWALRDGYRLIDTARIYGNETGVGRGIQRAIDEGIVKRKDIFVTTKMWTDDYDNGASAINGSLKRLGLDYIDLMILHYSQPENDVKAYKAMEKAVKQGKLKSIGLSNYYTPKDFDRLVNAVTVVPALLQNETHPYHQSSKMKEHLKQYGTVMESWFPLGGRGNTQKLFNDKTIKKIAKAHNKTSAQVILRWHLQAGNIAIPGSSNEDHIKENFEIFDFELTKDEMKQMGKLDKDERFADY